MKPLIAWPPLSADIVVALQRLEAAQKFDDLYGDYVLLEQEAHRRTLPALLAMTPGPALYALLYGGAQALGWIRWPEFLTNLGWIAIIPFSAIITNVLRGAEAAKDEMRIQKALNKWRDHAATYAVSQRT